MSEPFLEQWCRDLRAKVAAFDEDDEMAAIDMRPLPPPALIRRVNSVEKADPRIFLRSGARDLLAIVETLLEAIERKVPGDARPFPAHPAVMELGCGVGRLLRHGPPPSLARVVATDVNAASLDWCRANLPAVDYHHHGPQPPIASLPACAVDIIYAHSVFTHIPLERQSAWLHEMARLLRPGGWLIVTFLGREQREALLTPEQRAHLSETGAMQIHPEWAPGDRPREGGEIAFGAVCQTVPHQETAVSAIFELGARRARSGRQDVLAVRRR